MASTVSYSASLCTRHYNSSSNAKNGYASQEFYDSSYNNVGIISFVGMNLANKVITSIWLDIDASKAGYGAGSTKTVFMRKANYQNGIASGIELHQLLHHRVAVQCHGGIYCRRQQQLYDL